MLIYQLHSYFRDINLPDLELKIKEVSLELSKNLKQSIYSLFCKQILLKEC